MTQAVARFQFYGLVVEVSGNDLLVESTSKDFSHFLTPERDQKADVAIVCHSSEPPWKSLPTAKCVMVQPHFVAYNRGPIRYVDYHSRALSRWDFRTERGELWSQDFDLLYEKLYLVIHSRVGELLDRKGLHRVHALGLSRNGQGILCLLPSGGGKTTLGLMAVQMEGVSLLSDDSPLLDRRGSLYPFPVRIGLTHKPDQFPEKWLRRFRRQEHGEKWLVDLDALADKIADGPTPASALLLGHRMLTGTPSIHQITKREVLPEVLKSIVVGLGLPQLVEYFMRMNLNDMREKLPLVFSRLMASLALVRTSRTYAFDLSPDRDANRRAFETFLKTTG